MEERKTKSYYQRNRKAFKELILVEIKDWENELNFFRDLYKLLPSETRLDLIQLYEKKIGLINAKIEYLKELL